MVKLIPALIFGILLAGCAALVHQSTPPPKVVYVAVPAPAPEPPPVVLPVWENSKLTAADKDNFSLIGKSYVITICQKDAVIAQLMTYLDAYRHQPDGKPAAQTVKPMPLSQVIAEKCGAE